MMIALLKIVVLVVALVGRVSAGSFTTTWYTGAACAVPSQTMPSQTMEWTSGECVAANPGPGFFGDPEFPQALAASNPALAPAYMKVTCAAGVATIEHFSDAACTAANEISAEDIDAATAGLVRGPMVAGFEGIGMAGMANCVSAAASGISGFGVAAEEPVCGGVVLTMDEVRHCHVRTLPALHHASDPKSVGAHRHAPASQLSSGGWRTARLEKKPKPGQTQRLLTGEIL